MKRVNAWFDRAPLGLVFLTIAVVWIAIRLVFAALNSNGLTLESVLFEVIGGLVFAGVFTGIIGYRRRRSGGAAAWASLNQGMRSGALPEDADPAVWIPELERRRRAVLRGRVVSPIFFGLFAVAALVFLLVASQTVSAVVFFVFFAAVAVGQVWVSRRALRRIDSLKAQIDGLGNYQPTPTY
jgi:amino acid transporter